MALLCHARHRRCGACQLTVGHARHGGHLPQDVSVTGPVRVSNLRGSRAPRRLVNRGDRAPDGRRGAGPHVEDATGAPGQKAGSRWPAAPFQPKSTANTSTFRAR